VAITSPPDLRVQTCRGSPQPATSFTMTEPDTEDFDQECSEEAFVLQECNTRERAIMDFFGKALNILVAYQAHQRSVGDIRMSTRAMQMALGVSGGGYGTTGPSELARMSGCSKQMVDECLNQFMKRLGLDALPGQRKRDARRNMKSAREEQLEPHKP